MSDDGGARATPAVMGLPDAIDTLKQMAAAEAKPDDPTSQEVVSLLTLAWVAATRWRIEQTMDLTGL